VLGLELDDHAPDGQLQALAPGTAAAGSVAKRLIMPSLSKRSTLR
jgi:hypothetical protein